MLACTATILVAAATSVPPPAAPAASPPLSRPVPAAAPGPAPAPSDSAAPGLPAALPQYSPTGVEKTMTEALRSFTEAHDSHTREVDALVEAFPVYAPPGRRWSGSVRIVGSSSMAPLLTNMAIAFESIHDGLDIDVRQGGSVFGFDELCAGRAGAAAISHRLLPGERERIERTTGRRVIEVAIALDAVCVYVNADNPLPSLTKAMCNGIFSMAHSMTPAPIYRWSQIDPASPLKDEFMPIYVLNERSGTMQAFREWCMPGEDITTAMRFVEPGPSSVVNACCAYPLAMGVAGFNNWQPRARQVPLVPDAGGPAVSPSVASIRDRSYPLWRPFCLVFPATPSGSAPEELADFCRFALSEVGQDLVSSLGSVPASMDRIPAEIGAIAGDAWVIPGAPAPADRPAAPQPAAKP